LYAGTHPLLRDPLSPVTPGGLRRLSAAPAFRIASGENDVRGWDVIGENQVCIGVVSDLMIDPEAEQVRYAVVRRAVDDRETAVPIGYTVLHERSLHTPLSVEDMRALPELTGDSLQRAEEASLRAVLDSLLAGSRRYLRPDFSGAA
jgi:hypothetical protein